MSDEAPERILVVANETVGGRALIDAVKAHAEQRPVRVRVVCPQNQPRHGLVVRDEQVRSAAHNRLETTIAQLRAAGIGGTGEVLDPDPYTAIMDALATDPADSIIISTHPATRSGWLRRDLIERVREDTGLPVEHVVVDLDADRSEAIQTLVVANQTVTGETLIQALKHKAEEEPHRFVVVTPYSTDSADDSAARLADTLERLNQEGLTAIGQVMDPDPYTAIQNAMQFYAVDEIVISTLPETRSGWLRQDLVGRVRASTGKPVEHVVVTPEDAQTGARQRASA